MRAGANAYLAKGKLQRPLPAIDRELREAVGREACRVSEATHATMVNIQDYSAWGSMRYTIRESCAIP
jgi:hypothetical protein